MTLAFVGLLLGTLVSEDGACVLAGLLIAEGAISPVAGIAACLLGIWVGDMGLWLAGRWAGPRALAWPAVRRRVTPELERRVADRLVRHAATLIVGSRFLPGTRLPVYVASGAFGMSFRQFAGWSLVAVSVWTPIVVWGASRLGDVVSAPLGTMGGPPWLQRVLIAATVVVIARTLVPLATRRGRQRAAARVARVWRWEFWPMWLFYAPVGPWLLWLAVRYRGFGAISAANPGMPDGGIVGESKYGILQRLPEEWTIPALLAEPGDPGARLRRLLEALADRGWTWPLVFKPDVGQRGAGVRVIRTVDDAQRYLGAEPRSVVVQPYHPGPYEAGVFYYRLPHWTRGRILSITDKHFPSVAGDGRSTLEDLIWRDSRLRMQARTFLARHAVDRDRVLAAGEHLPLGRAGNHAQGTMFRDGAHLITPALEDRIDRIAKHYDGFFIGRFDIRYADVDRFKAGEDLAIVELNGATAESTNIYDPDRSLPAAYRQLFLQWSLVFAIGDANRRRGASVASWRRLLAILREHRSAKPGHLVSD